MYLKQWLKRGLKTSWFPNRPPTRLWVVEIGNPKRVAVSTVAPAPIPTAIRKYTVPATSSGTRPLPEKLLTRLWAKKIAHNDPRNVARVAIVMADL